jgi:uncharacterized protein (TIGR02300 family)
MPVRAWQTTPLSETKFTWGSITLVKADLGTKRVCPNCSVRFYDLQKRPIECPKCAFTFEPESLYKQRRPRQPEAAVAVAAVVASDDEESDEESEEAETEEAEDTLVEAEPVLLPVENEDDEVVEQEDDAGVTVVEPDAEAAIADLGDEEIDEDEAADALLEEVEDDEEDVTDIIDADIEKEDR